MNKVYNEIRIICSKTKDNLPVDRIRDERGGKQE